MSKENCNNAQEVAQKADFGNEEVPFLGLLKNTPSKSLIFGQQLSNIKKKKSDKERQFVKNWAQF